MTRISYSQLAAALSLFASALFGWHLLANTFALSLHDSRYTYILLILPISAAMLWQNRAAIQAAASRGIPAGCALLLAAIAIAFLANTYFQSSLAADVRLSISMFTLVLSWVGAFVLAFGIRAVRTAFFSLCLLFFMVPPPPQIADAAVTLLQSTSASAAYALFVLLGVPVLQTGNILVIPGLTVEVAQECSSIRSSSMLLLTTIVLAQILLRSPLRRMLVIAIALPLSVAKNAVRICTIAMLGTKVDPAYLTGRLHHQGGVIFFAIALAAICALLWILRRGEIRLPSPA